MSNKMMLLEIYGPICRASKIWITSGIPILGQKCPESIFLKWFMFWCKYMPQQLLFLLWKHHWFLKIHSKTKICRETKGCPLISDYHPYWHSVDSILGLAGFWGLMPIIYKTTIHQTIFDFISCISLTLLRSVYFLTPLEKKCDVWTYRQTASSPLICRYSKYWRTMPHHERFSLVE